MSEAADELQSSAEPERLRPLNERLWAAVDRRLGSLLPLLEYRIDALPAEIAALVDLAGRSPATRSPYSAWIDGARWPVWLVTLIVGTVAVALDEPAGAVMLWDQRAPYDGGRPLPAARLGGGAELGQALTRAREAHIVGSIELWYPACAVYDSQLLRTYYAEILRGGDIPDSVLGFLSRAGDFLWLCGAMAGRDGIEMIQFWICVPGPPHHCRSSQSGLADGAATGERPRAQRRRVGRQASGLGRRCERTAWLT